MTTQLATDRQALDAGLARVGTLVVFSDDWGRHPSSSQHLIAHLPAGTPVLWINTIGTRGLRFDRATLKRVIEKLAAWFAPARRSKLAAVDQSDASGLARSASLAPSLAPPGGAITPRVIAPIMWPGFSSRLSRVVNAFLIARSLRAALKDCASPIVVLTTLPLMADLVPRFPGARWVYYCVDDFSVWPGYDGDTMQVLERLLVPRVDLAIAVSQPLVDHLAALGCRADLLTHGVDLARWREADMTVLPQAVATIDRPLIVFWGVIDRRMDLTFLRALQNRLAGRAQLVLIGPQEDPDPAVFELPDTSVLPAFPMGVLPAIAARAAVLVMPYIDAPVTRAMQPLKLKEYLATGRAVVVRDLPSTREWADACDLCQSSKQFAAAVVSRMEQGVGAAQLQARARLDAESWHSKADQLMLAVTRNSAQTRHQQRS